MGEGPATLSAGTEPSGPDLPEPWQAPGPPPVPSMGIAEVHITGKHGSPSRCEDVAATCAFLDQANPSPSFASHLVRGGAFCA